MNDDLDELLNLALIAADRVRDEYPMGGSAFMMADRLHELAAKLKSGRASLGHGTTTAGGGDWSPDPSIGAGGGGGGPPDIHPAILGLLAELPPAGTMISDKKRASLIGAFTGLMGYLYPDTDE